jgi:hypothetical protein
MSASSWGCALHIRQSPQLGTRSVPAGTALSAAEDFQAGVRFVRARHAGMPGVRFLDGAIATVFRQLSREVGI